MKKNKKYSSFFIRRIKSKAGSALIWALAVALILAIVIAAGLNIVQRQQNANVQQHIENQAYFSAMSVNRAIMNWLNGASSSYTIVDDGKGNVTEELNNGDERNDFISWVLSQPIPPDNDGFFQLSITGMEFADVMGDITFYATHNGMGTELSIKTVANYNGETSSVIGRLTNDPTQVVVPGRPGVAKIEVPDPPSYPTPGLSSSGPELINSNTNPNNPAGDYYTTSRTQAFSGNVNTLIVQDSSDFQFNGQANIVVIKANAKLTIGKDTRIDYLIIEDGGRTDFTPPATIIGNKNAHCEVFVRAGGSFINSQNGTNNTKIVVYLFASNDPNKIARADLAKMKDVIDIILQPIGSYGGYTANIGNPASVTFTGKIHLPIGYIFNGVSYGMSNYSTMPNWGTLSPKVCNPVGGNVRPGEAPFCPHFLALNDPDRITHSDVWTYAGYKEG